MSPALYYKIYGDGMDEEVIPRHIKYFKLCYLYYLIKNYIWRVGFEAKN